MSYRDDEDVVGRFGESDELSDDLSDDLDLDEDFADEDLGFGEEEEEETF